jgi:hypothetical protein
MGKYTNSGTNTLALNPTLPTCLYPGDYKYVWGTSVASGSSPTPGQIQTPNDTNINFESPAVASRSLAVALAPRPGGGAPPGVIVQVNASGNPGAAEVDIQDAAIDADGAYLTPTNSSYKLTSWTQNGGVWTAWAELQPESGNFVSLKLVANPNAVNFTAKIIYV